ncbi:MAG: asparaginase [Magnetospirillum sp.]|nr:asparaginase [Magnetospirillum sp.]
MNLPSPNPVLVEVRRGDVVESFHRGAVAVADAAGRLVAAWGDTARPVYPRSALKPVQALALVETGAWGAYGLGTEELALAAASHAGSAIHTDRVAGWLRHIGLGAEALECGGHAPSDPAASRALAASDSPPSPLHNNCSGKHAGFLTVARHLRVPTRGYIRRDHPVQNLVAGAIGAMSGCVPVTAAPCGIDGCGIPVFALPLAGLAAAMARMAAPGGFPASRRAAAREIVAAMLSHPHLVAGRGRLCTEFMRAIPRIALKGGAEGVYVAIVPERGWGVAVKIDDGAGRAAEVAILAVLRRLGLLAREDLDRLAARVAPPLLNVAGRRVGEIRATEWL